MRGRKPTPTALRIVKGNPGKRPLPANEATPAAGIPPCPEHITGEARREWERLGAQLDEAGLLTVVDRDALAAFCVAWARWVEAEQALSKHGLLIKSPNGYPMPSPYLAIANKAMEQMRVFLAEFGMTPASRSRVTAAPKGDASNPFGDIA